jgi:hypothetical protein
VPLLLKAAQRLEPIDISLARATYLDALTAGLLAGDLAVGGVLDVARAARAAPRRSTLTLTDLLIDGLAAYIIDGFVAALPAVRRAINAARHETSPDEQLRCLYQTCAAAIRIWEDESWEVLSQRHLTIVRAAGALAEISLGGVTRSIMHVFAGDLATAESLLEEMRTVAHELQTETEAIGSSMWQYVDIAAIVLASFRGDQTAATELNEATTTETTTRGQGGIRTWLAFLHALLNNGLGRYSDAMAAARDVAEQPAIGDASHFAAAELVEAAAHCGATSIAAEALTRLTQTTSACATDWALGVEMRSRAQLAEGAEADRLYREAIERLDRTRIRPDLVRAHLVYGEWLRRERRRTDARTHLRTAHEMFNEMGMRGFAERTRRELWPLERPPASAPLPSAAHS